MRVRPQRQADRRLLGLRRPHVIDARTAAEPPAPEAEHDEEVVPGDHVDERRHRAAVAPEDHALYRCQCGYQFEASVSASVCCPHCGCPQAW